MLLSLTRSRSVCDSRIGSYRRAFKELRGQKIAPMAFYVHQDWDTSQVLPWQHIQGPLPQATLIKHIESATAQLALHYLVCKTNNYSAN